MQRPFPPLPGFQAGDIEPELDILHSRAPGKQRVLLEYDAAVARRSVDDLTVEQDAPTARCRQATEQIQQGRLAAAARPDQRKELAGPNIQRDVVQRSEALRRPAILAPDQEVLPDMLEADLGHGHLASAVLPARK
ncbi:hypothetical protein ACVWZK_000025 [Bradyrhizobium sp. GM0.4]